MTQATTFKIGDPVVYPAHGVGRVIAFETTQVGESELDLLCVSCERGMVLKVPAARAENGALRHLSDNKTIQRAFDTLRDAPRQQQGIWARRVKDLDERVNSGDLVLISRLLRDLAPRQRSERGLSFSEREYFEKAITRASQEIALVQKREPAEVRAEMEKALSQQKPPIVAAPPQ